MLLSSVDAPHAAVRRRVRADSLARACRCPARTNPDVSTSRSLLRSGEIWIARQQTTLVWERAGLGREGNDSAPVTSSRSSLARPAWHPSIAGTPHSDPRGYYARVRRSDGVLSSLRRPTGHNPAAWAQSWARRRAAIRRVRDHWPIGSGQARDRGRRRGGQRRWTGRSAHRGAWRRQRRP